MDCVLDADKMESGSVIVAPRTNSAVNATTFRTPRHRLSIEKSLRRPLQQTAIPPGASAVLASREAAELKMSITGGGLKDWLYQYFAKVGCSSARVDCDGAGGLGGGGGEKSRGTRRNYSVIVALACQTEAIGLRPVRLG